MRVSIIPFNSIYRGYHLLWDDQFDDYVITTPYDTSSKFSPEVAIARHTNDLFNIVHKLLKLGPAALIPHQYNPPPIP